MSAVPAPRAVTAATIATLMSEAIRANSIAVTPEVSVKTCRKVLVLDQVLEPINGKQLLPFIQARLTQVSTLCGASRGWLGIQPACVGSGPEPFVKVHRSPSIAKRRCRLASCAQEDRKRQDEAAAQTSRLQSLNRPIRQSTQRPRGHQA